MHDHAPGVSSLTPPPDDGLDSRLLLLGIWRRRVFLVVAVMASLLCGAVLGKVMGKKIYATVSTVAFDPVTYEKAYNRAAPQPTELVGLAKAPENLEKTRATLGLHVTRDQIDDATEVSYDQPTNLIRVETDWPNPLQARDITNTLRDVFLSSVRDNIIVTTRNEIASLDDKLKQANLHVDQATKDLQNFFMRNGVSAVDLSGHPTGSEDLIQLSYTEALAERASVARELQTVNQNIALLAARVPAEEAAARKNAMIAQAAARSQALLAMVEQQRSLDANRAELLQARNEVARAERARTEGLISEQDYERAKTAYAKAQALVRGGKDFNSWQHTAHELAQPLDLSALTSTSPSQTQLEQLRLQSESLQRQLAMTTSRADQLRHQYEKMRRQDAQYPTLMEEYDRLNHSLLQAQTERNEADQQLARAHEVLANPRPTLAGISVVAPAALPLAPLKSRTKVIALGVAVVGIVCAFGFVVGSELLDKRQKAPAELAVKLAVPVLGTLPKLKHGGEQPDIAVAADFKRMARRLRDRVRGHGARVLLVSPQHGEGKSLVAQGLARALVNSGDDSVLLMDAEMNTMAGGPGGWRRMLPADMGVPTRGLEHYLRGQADDVDDVICPTRVPGVSCLPLIDRQRATDVLTSKRLPLLMAEVSQRFSLVLMEAPPLAEPLQHEELVRGADAIVLVVQNNVHELNSLRQALKSLAIDNVPVIGAVVTQVDALYLAEELRGEELRAS
jgi:Mrp family chromosome partitioning ATPase